LVSISKLAGTLRARGILSGPSSGGCEANRYAFEQPKSLHVILNRRAAHAPGLTVSPVLLAHVDEVIEQGLVHGIRNDIGAISHWRAEVRVRCTA